MAAYEFFPWSDEFVAWFVNIAFSAKSVDADLVWSRLTEALMHAATNGRVDLAHLLAVFSDDEGLLFITRAQARDIARDWRQTLAAMRKSGRLFDGNIRG